MTPSVLRAVLYLRLSASVEDSTSIARQEADLRALAAREGWEVVDVLVDDGVSGRKVRPKVAEAFQMLRDGGADVLAVWKLDRLTRQGLGAIGDLGDVLDAVPGSLFVALQDGLRSDQPAWRLIAAVLSEVARSEAESTAARIKSAIAYRKTVTGRFTGGGTIPYGYASVPAPEGPGRVLAVHPAEALVVRDVAERLLAGTESLTGIARDLTARGVATSKSKYRRAHRRGLPTAGLDKGHWSVATIKSLWTADTLLGRVSLGADVVRDVDGLPVTAWPPVLDLATLERLRARLRPAVPGAPRRRRASRLLSGVAFCAYCDKRLYVTASGGRAVYACPSSWNAYECPSPKVDALNLEDFVALRFLAAHGASAEVEVTEEVSDPGTVEALAEIEAALREATAALMGDDADTVALVRRLEALKAHRATLRSVPATVTTRVVPTGRTLGEAWEADGDDGARRTALLSALDHVAISTGRRVSPIDQDRVTFFWNS